MDSSKILMVCRMHIASRLFSTILGLLILCAPSAYYIVLAMLSGKFSAGIFFTTLIAFFIFFLGLLTPLVEHSYRLVIADDFVEQQYWRKIKIEYASVTEVEVEFRTLTLKANAFKFTTPGFVENREKALRLIAARLKSKPGFKLSGDSKRIKELFG